MRLDLRKLRFRQPKLVATHLCLLFGSRESRHYVRANTFMGPDPSLTLAACALCSRGRPASAGVCVGTLAFVKIPIMPVALLLSCCYLIARRRFGELIAFGSALAVAIAAALILLHFRSELWPLVETLKANV